MSKNKKWLSRHDNGRHFAISKLPPRIRWIERAGALRPHEKKKLLARTHTPEIQKSLARGKIPDVEKIDIKHGQPLDKNIIPLLQTLNKKGFTTTGSCGGH